MVGLDTFYYQGCDFGDPTSWKPAREAGSAGHPACDLEGFDAVVHLAALSQRPDRRSEPADSTYAINHDRVGTARRGRRKQAGVARFVFASSCCMYGAAEGDELVDRGRSAPAADSVRGVEGACRGGDLELADEPSRRPRCATRPPTGSSPRLRLDIVLNNLDGWAHTTGAIRLQSDGRPGARSSTFGTSRRATVALLAAAPDAIRGEAFNIGTAEQNYQIRTLAEVVQSADARLRDRVRRGGLVPIRAATASTSRGSRRAFRAAGSNGPQERGADELATAYDEVGLTVEELSRRALPWARPAPAPARRWPPDRRAALVGGLRSDLSGGLRQVDVLPVRASCTNPGEPVRRKATIVPDVVGQANRQRDDGQRRCGCRLRSGRPSCRRRRDSRRRGRGSSRPRHPRWRRRPCAWCPCGGSRTRTCRRRTSDPPAARRDWRSARAPRPRPPRTARADAASPCSPRDRARRQAGRSGFVAMTAGHDSPARAPARSARSATILRCGACRAQRIASTSASAPRRDR